jgi:hypothetical protein
VSFEDERLYGCDFASIHSEKSRGIFGIILISVCVVILGVLNFGPLILALTKYERKHGKNV